MTWVMADSSCSSPERYVSKKRLAELTRSGMAFEACGSTDTP